MHLSLGQRIAVWLAAAFYITAGVLHFLRPEFYMRIMPPYMPWHAALVAISGGAEIVGGLGLLIPKTQRWAAWGLIALLIAVFPANWFMATHPTEAAAAALPGWALWGRLPLQALFVWWLLWCTRPGPAGMFDQREVRGG